MKGRIIMNTYLLFKINIKEGDNDILFMAATSLILVRVMS